MKKAEMQKRVNQINRHMSTIGWKSQCDNVDKAIGSLSPAQIVEWEDRIHPDLIPYLSAFHVSWLFEVCWAHPGGNPADRTDTPPENYDPSTPLSKARIWAPQDYI